MDLKRLERIALKDPAGIAPAVRKVLPDASGHDAVYLNRVLCHVPEEDWEQLLDAALDTLEEFGEDHRGAEVVVETALEQFTPLAFTRIERMIQLCLDGAASDRIVGWFGNDELTWENSEPIRSALPSAGPFRRTFLYTLAGSQDLQVFEFLCRQLRPMDGDFDLDFARWAAAAF